MTCSEMAWHRFRLRFGKMPRSMPFVICAFSNFRPKHGKALNRIAKPTADAGLDDIIAYEVHREAVSRQQEEDPVYDLGREGGSEESKSVRDWDGIFAGLSLTDAADLSLAYMRFKEGPIPWDTRELFAQLFARTATGDEATVIACLSNMPVVGLFDLRNALESVPDAWRSRGACKAAIRTC